MRMQGNGKETGKMTRRAEKPDLRPRQGVVASENSLGDIRSWVVWGTEAPPERTAEPERGQERPGTPGNDLARRIAESTDTEWRSVRDEQKWIVLWEAKEEDVDAWVLDDPSVRGYAPYLMESDAAARAPVTMRGVLRNDVVRRRSTSPGWQ